MSVMADAITVPLQCVDDDLELPRYAKPGDAGLDVRSSVDVVIKPGERCVVPCGFRIALPEGYAGLMVPRSGLAARCGITIVNAPGLIDSGYRGELKVILLNTDAHESFSITKGDRIAQLVIIHVPTVTLIEAPQLDETVRGESGFGSSGV